MRNGMTPSHGFEVAWFRKYLMAQPQRWMRFESQLTYSCHILLLLYL
jgi:hypothetical protein